jgi:hypothetical protein
MFASQHSNQYRNNSKNQHVCLSKVDMPIRNTLLFHSPRRNTTQDTNPTKLLPKAQPKPVVIHPDSQTPPSLGLKVLTPDICPAMMKRGLVTDSRDVARVYQHTL